MSARDKIPHVPDNSSIWTVDEYRFAMVDGRYWASSSIGGRWIPAYFVVGGGGDARKNDYSVLPWYLKSATQLHQLIGKSCLDETVMRDADYSANYFVGGVAVVKVMRKGHRLIQLYDLCVIEGRLRHLSRVLTRRKEAVSARIMAARPAGRKIKNHEIPCPYTTAIEQLDLQ